MFTISSEVGHVIDDEDEDPLLKRIRLENAGLEQYETEWAYFNILIDPIMHLMAGCYLPKDGKNKKSYTLVVFESGNTVTAVGKPEDIYKDLVAFLESNPDTTDSKKQDE